MDMLEFVSENMYVLTPVLYFLGTLLKNTPKIPDWLIPYILIIIGIVLAFGLAGISVNSLIQGILVAGATVLAHQLVKQTSLK